MSRTPVYQGRVVNLGIEHVTLPNGRAVSLEVIRHPGAAAVVPLHADGSVTLIRQHRHAAGGSILEIPAGLVEPGEDPVEAAVRELQEEVGLRADELRPLGSILTTPGFTDERIHLYLGVGLVEVGASPEDDEVIEPLRLPLEEALDRVMCGDIVDGKSICGLMMAARSLWGTGTRP